MLTRYVELISVSFLFQPNITTLCHSCPDCFAKNSVLGFRNDNFLLEYFPKNPVSQYEVLEFNFNQHQNKTQKSNVMLKKRYRKEQRKILISVRVDFLKHTLESPGYIIENYNEFKVINVLYMQKEI